GHPALLQYLAIADGETTARTKFELTEVSIRLEIPSSSGLLTSSLFAEDAPAVWTASAKGGRLGVVLSCCTLSLLHFTLVIGVNAEQSRQLPAHR
ncbi:MAG: hypothetical protein EPN48_18580, partial [Microbacteriaceae bacterium]